MDNLNQITAGLQRMRGNRNLQSTILPALLSVRGKPAGNLAQNFIDPVRATGRPAGGPVPGGITVTGGGPAGGGPGFVPGAGLPRPGLIPNPFSDSPIQPGVTAPLPITGAGSTVTAPTGNPNPRFWNAGPKFSNSYGNYLGSGIGDWASGLMTARRML